MFGSRANRPNRIGDAISFFGSDGAPPRWQRCVGSGPIHVSWLSDIARTARAFSPECRCRSRPARFVAVVAEFPNRPEQSLLPVPNPGRKRFGGQAALCRAEYTLSGVFRQFAPFTGIEERRAPKHTASMDSATRKLRETIVEPDREGQRLDNFLARELGAVPRALVYRLIRTGQVRVNGGRAKPMRKLTAGDRVRIPPFRADGAAPVRLPRGRIEQVRAAIIHRQPEFVVVDKPSGLASQRGSGLAFGLTDLVAEIEPDSLPVHRLDRGTSGLMIFARGTANARALQCEFSENRVEKRYLALLDGALAEDRVVIDQPLKKIRDAGGQRRVIVAPDGQPARSEFRRLRRLGAREFVEVRIETGRTHQIRAHAAWLGAPLAGDDRYNPAVPPDGLRRLFLHAGYLRLAWPCDQVFCSPLPDELEQVLDALS